MKKNVKNERNLIGSMQDQIKEEVKSVPCFLFKKHCLQDIKDYLNFVTEEEEKTIPFFITIRKKNLQYITVFVRIVPMIFFRIYKLLSAKFYRLFCENINFLI